MPLSEPFTSDTTSIPADPLPEDALPLPGEDAPPGDGAPPPAREEPPRSAEERLSRYHDAVLETLSRGDAARDELLSRLDRVLEAQERSERRLAQALRENADFQIQVRRGMQQELDALRKQQEGEQFTPLLRELASIYVEYGALLDCGELPERPRSNLRTLIDRQGRAELPPSFRRATWTSTTRLPRAESPACSAGVPCCTRSSPTSLSSIRPSRRRRRRQLIQKLTMQKEETENEYLRHRSGDDLFLHRGA